MLINKSKTIENLKESINSIEGIIENIKSDYYFDTNKEYPNDALNDLISDIEQTKDNIEIIMIV